MKIAVRAARSMAVRSVLKSSRPTLCGRQPAAPPLMMGILDRRHKTSGAVNHEIGERCVYT
jgi:hypothetical protein